MKIINTVINGVAYHFDSFGFIDISVSTVNGGQSHASETEYRNFNTRISHFSVSHIYFLPKMIL
jgi:hypothetical protein